MKSELELDLSHKLMISSKLPDLSPKAEDHLTSWAHKELTTGKRTITKDEAEKKIHEIVKMDKLKLSKKDWAALEKMFDEADLNHDGELDMEEFMHAIGEDEDEGEK